MKKRIVILLIIVSFLYVFISCLKNSIPTETMTETFKKTGLENKYKDAYLSCIFYIENSANSHRNIDTSMVSVELLNENKKELVHIIDNEDISYFKDAEATYWLFTIGNTVGHDFILLVCDSKSNKTIGTILIK